MSIAEGRLAAVLARHGLQVEAVRRLAGGGRAPSFRLQLASGELAKLRLYPSGADAARVDACLRLAAPGLLPRALARVGRRLIVEFIEGTTLDRRLHARPRDDSRPWATRTGRLLARLHASPVGEHSCSPPGVFVAFIERGLHQLVRRKLLHRDESARLQAAAVPSTAEPAITHGDLSPENLVIDRRGRLHAIDEERVAVRPPPYDLARTICHWPPGSEGPLLRGYRAAGGHTKGYDEHRTFWLTSALTTSTAYRLRHRPQLVGPAVAALRRLARG